MSFDLQAAVYVFCANYHGGQGSREYRIMSRLARGGLMLNDRAWEAIQYGCGRACQEWAEAHEMYGRLVASYKERTGKV